MQLGNNNQLRRYRYNYCYLIQMKLHIDQRHIHAADQNYRTKSQVRIEFRYFVIFRSHQSYNIHHEQAMDVHYLLGKIS